MDCNNARLLLEFARPVPGELDLLEAAALHDHLDQCADCGTLAQAEQRVDLAIGRAMQAVPFPDGLRTRLLTSLDRQRDAWYRRFIMRRVLPVGAAAAAVLLVVFLGWQWKQQQRIRPNLEQLHAEVNERFEPELKDVNTWLRTVGGDKLEAPPRFNYYRLERYFLSEVQGQTVPTLFFAVNTDNNGDRKMAYAWVYVLSENRFDLKRLENQAQWGTGNVKIHTLPHNDHVHYVVVYTGDKLDRFYDKKAGLPNG